MGRKWIPKVGNEYWMLDPHPRMLFYQVMQVTVLGVREEATQVFVKYRGRSHWQKKPIQWESPIKTILRTERTALKICRKENERTLTRSLNSAEFLTKAIKEGRVILRELAVREDEIEREKRYGVRKR